MTISGILNVGDTHSLKSKDKCSLESIYTKKSDNDDDDEDDDNDDE